MQGRFKESLSALQSGLSVDPNNAAQIKEKTDTEACVRKVERATEMLAQVWSGVWAACGGPAGGWGWGNADGVRGMSTNGVLPVIWCFDFEISPLACREGVTRNDNFRELSTVFEQFLRRSCDESVKAHARGEDGF